MGVVHRHGQHCFVVQRTAANGGCGVGTVQASNLVICDEGCEVALLTGMVDTGRKSVLVDVACMMQQAAAAGVVWALNLQGDMLNMEMLV